MVPALFAPIDELPRGTSGKLHRDDLPLIEAAGRGAARAAVGPRNPLEVEGRAQPGPFHDVTANQFNVGAGGQIGILGIAHQGANVVAVMQKPLQQMAADKTSSAREKNLH